MAGRKFSPVESGRALAVEMLQRLGDYERNALECYQWSIEAKYREEGTPQENVLLEYLWRCTDPAALAGFCAVLTDYIGYCADGGAPEPELYVKLTERDTTGAPGKWPTMADEEEERKKREEKKYAAFRGFIVNPTERRT